MFEFGLIMIGVAIALTAIFIIVGLIVAVTKDEDVGAAIGVGGGIFFWALYTIGIGVTIIGAVIKFL
jgi:hypothetical protein